MRSALTNLASNAESYGNLLRKAGYSCCHIETDWMIDNCSEEDMQEHNIYLIEYIRESLVSDAQAEIIYSDELNCVSPWLNAKKAERACKHGPVSELMKNSETRHFAQLSPCLRKMSRIYELLDERSVNIKQSLVNEFLQRRKAEEESHKDSIKFCSSRMGVLNKIDRNSLQHEYTMQIFNCIGGDGAQVMRTVQMYGVRSVIVFELAYNYKFVVLPTITLDEVSDGVAGCVGMGFRLTDNEALTSDKFNKNRYAVLHLSNLFPGELSEYGRFNNISELCLNISAWGASLNIILHDTLRALRRL